MLAFLGGILALCGFDDWKTRKRFRKTRTQTIIDAPGDGVVRIHGKVCPGEEGVVHVPLLEREAVWYCLTVSERVKSGKSSTWRERIRKTDERVFLVDDGSGPPAVVQPHAGKAVVDKQTIASCGFGNDPSLEFDTFLIENGMKSTGIIGFNKTLRCEVQYIAPDDMVHVLGPSRRAGQAFGGFYRTNSSPLVLSIDEQTKEPLHFSNKTEAQLTGISWLFLVGMVVLLLGMLTLAAECATLVG